MQRHTLTGTRIRDRRLQSGLKQADLAAAADISASYLNLIEHNRRNIGGALLTRLARVLAVEPAVLRDGADAGLVQELQSLADEAGLGKDRLEEFIERFPDWAAQLGAQKRQIDGLEETLRGLNDRLTHDPVLSEKMHDVLGAVAAIRATSSILVDTPDINAEWRARFHLNIDDESRKLAETSAEMAAHFDRLTQQDPGFVTPIEAVTAFFERRSYFIRELEEPLGHELEQLLDREPEFSASAARKLGEQALRRYQNDAVALPFAPFQDAALEHEFDPSALAEHFAADLPRVFRRLATLPRTPEMPEIGLVSCDGAGAILMRKPPSGFAMPRFGAACPLWPLFAALHSPGAPMRQSVVSTEGAAFTAYALASAKRTARFDSPPVLEASMLLISSNASSEASLTLGSTCRVCPRQNCEARREPSILSAGSVPRQ